ncbi:glycosyltransferase [Marivirga lumbricoides]|uniref:Glycosyltransferase n=1 Tax=Marivirga lumbricoides TaxID=1046115 RepID=A0A2T4DNY3_9BACT|nr:glycosyltransferase [Marivirga lumbricoides]
MKIVLFYHSLASDWNHGNAHFLRGICSELIRKGHEVKVYEPEKGWSLENLMNDHGPEKASEFQSYYPTLETNFYAPEKPDFSAMLSGADLVIVHEWNPHELVEAIGEKKKEYGYKLLFHDTHHRVVSDSDSMEKYNFSNYDGALVFGEVLRNIYLDKGWMSEVWTWHEAADAKLFKPLPDVQKEGDLVWIGNWGDNERTDELMELLVKPIKELGLKAKFYGVRYPQIALNAMRDANIEYGGHLPNYKVPEVFARYHVTVHVPRRNYVKILPGIPTIRPFEALACGIPLISTQWQDKEHLFTPGQDYLVANNGEKVKEQLQKILQNKSLSGQLAENGRKTILNKHTCRHRVEELEAIVEQLGIAHELTTPLLINPLEA